MPDRLGSLLPRATWMGYRGQFDSNWLGNDIPATGMARPIYR